MIKLFNFAHMEADRIKWNKKHAEKTGWHPADSFLSRYNELLAKNKVLDLACGRGRNSFYLADKEFQVYATDLADIALSSLKDHVASHGLKIITFEGDLDEPEFLLKFAPYNSIICINFKPEAKLLQTIPKILETDGIFLWCSFNEKQAEIKDFPMEKALHPSEFVDFFDSLQLVIYERFKDSTGFRDGYIFKKQ